MTSARSCVVPVLLGVLLLTGCGGGGSEPSPVTLAELVVDQDDFDGRLVSTEGTVRTFDQPRHYWIEDAEQNRVELVPRDEIAPHLGEHVRVSGRFTFCDDEGRRIALEDIDVLSGEPHTRP